MILAWASYFLKKKSRHGSEVSRNMLVTDEDNFIRVDVVKFCQLDSELEKNSGTALIHVNISMNKY